VVIDKDEVFVSVGGPRRVYDVKLEDGSDVDPSKYYTISSNSFILGGGDGYSMFTNCEIVKTAVGVDNEALLKYIEDNLNGSIPYKYKASEGRIIVTDGKINDNISVSLLGFENLTITPQLITFNDYLLSLEKIKFEFPKQLNFKTTLTKKTRLRALQETEKEALCIIQNEVNETTAKYSCEIPNDGSDINSIKLEPNFTNFDVKVSPHASEYISNLEKLNNGDKSVDNIINKENYILQNSTYEEDGNNFIISGVIDSETAPTFSSNELDLTVSKLPNNETTNLKCTVEKVTDNKYNLKCKRDPNVSYNLENSLLTDGDKVLITNFAEGADAILDGGNGGDTNARIYHKKSSGLSGGLIALIVIIPIVAIAITVALILFLRKSHPNPPEPIPDASTMNSVKNL
jgi:hypothetical protein